ncbi:hypothetical protein GGF32_002848 [Allomyces javanicus]|nr:hypothetical protein GGF32_002848 [Allomyces javanicus]
MARKSRAAPTRTAAPSRPASTVATPPMHRPAPAPAAPVSHAAPAAHAAPAHHTPAPAAPAPVVEQRQPGLFAQMATTAAGVAVGSAVGHTIGAGITSIFSGSSSNDAAHAPAPQPQAVAAPPANFYGDYQQSAATACETDLKAYMKCMEGNPADPNACSYYFDLLKQCQARFR